MKTSINLTGTLLSDDRQVRALKTRIAKYLDRRSGVSFAEMARDIPGFAGDVTWGREDQGIILWAGISSAAIAALQRLLDEGRIVPTPTTWLVYNFDGAVLDMPIADSIRRTYKRPHWLPVVFAGMGEAA